MLDQLLGLVGGGVQLAILAAVFGGVLLLVRGAAVALGPRDAIERRLDRAVLDRGNRARIALRAYSDEVAPYGIGHLIAPIDPRERLQLRQRLVRAGFRGGRAIANYYVLRALLGLVLPLPLVIGLTVASLGAPDGAKAAIPGLGITIGTALLLAVGLQLLGFIGPPLWLRHRIAQRQEAIREGFPHALDMLQVAIEAGLGFDSALARVARELRHAHPALADEFAIVGLELRAGKARDQVLTNLAERTGVDAVSAFATVVMQSIAYGSGISGPLQVYAREMRHKRMMVAEEKANQLPVKMSVVMVLFLLPTLMLVALSPVMIRLVRMFSTALFTGT
jgi:tight adherence protein C